LVFSGITDQHPVGDVDGIDGPIVVHGPPISIGGVNGLGGGTIGTDEAGAMDIAG
jgi:hypothetical protein